LITLLGADMLEDVHPAQVAGLFYPEEAQTLRALIAAKRKGALPDGGVAPKAVVAPHAGIVYSGSVAATAFGPWAGRPEPPRRVVIAGPAHRFGFRGLALHPAQAWSTPLGETKVARDLHVRLMEAGAAAVDARPFAGEHSLEMHLVMLQAMLPAPFEILPILVGDAEPAEVAKALRLVWGGQETVVALSSDLSHFLDRASAEKIDTDTARRIEVLDASLEGRRACGYLPITGALAIAAERDLRVSRLHLATSADVGADASRVVGYGAFSFEYAASARLTETDRATLVSACMAAIAAAARQDGRMPRISLEGRLSPALSAHRATFVTLSQSGGLRGCVGSPAVSRPLIDDAIANAVRAGFADPRFARLSEAELHGLRLDLSILSHPRPIAAANEAELISALEPDRDGLVLGVGRQRALFLPSVWRQVADPHEFVRHLMLKAGLDPRIWPRGLAAAHFRVETFGAPWRTTSPAEIAPVRIEEEQRLH
jgi:AmmeMemoRadiSam system protein B/AmmeMemoRadiSam system protein A